MARTATSTDRIEESDEGRASARPFLFCGACVPGYRMVAAKNRIHENETRPFSALAGCGRLSQPAVCPPSYAVCCRQMAGAMGWSGGHLSHTLEGWRSLHGGGSRSRWFADVRRIS